MKDGVKRRRKLIRRKKERMVVHFCFEYLKRIWLKYKGNENRRITLLNNGLNEKEQSEESS